MVCFGLLGLAWATPRMFEDGGLTRYLASKRILPELMRAMAPAIDAAIGRAFLVAAAGLLVASLLWTAEASLAPPTGPGQVTGGWRRLTWWMLAIAAPASVFLLTVFGPLGDRGHIDGAAAYRFSFVLALAVLFLFWILSLLGTERLVRPAVPAGSILIGRG